MKSTFYETVQCYKMLHPENLTGFHNVCTVVDTPKIVLLVFGLVVLVSVTSNHYQMTSILKVHNQLSAILLLNY